MLIHNLLKNPSKLNEIEFFGIELSVTNTTYDIMTNKRDLFEKAICYTGAKNIDTLYKIT